MSNYKYLPYTDEKDRGAADFYFAINATFRFIHEKFGMTGLREYWTNLADDYYAPVSAIWRNGGLPAIKRYWQEFFTAEPNSQVDVCGDDLAVTVEVKICPAIFHLKKHGRDITPYFCEHCRCQDKRLAENAGFDLKFSGGQGRCRRVFSKREANHAGRL